MRLKSNYSDYIEVLMNYKAYLQSRNHKETPSGIINIYKEKGWSSFDVANKIKHICRVNKSGHTGTLDPQAEGVLPICIGKATKVVEFLTDKDKIYEASCMLGIATDTQDHTGIVLTKNAVNVTTEAVVEALKSFIGDIKQMPPMFSALKHKGRRLYKIAREGNVVERKKRSITIYDITNIVVELPVIHFTVACSKGTYIRTICHDLGEMLGTGGHMIGLKRTKVGEFNVDSSYTIEGLQDYLSTHTLDSILKPLDSVFYNYPAVMVESSFNKWLFNGCKIPVEFTNHTETLAETMYRVYDEENNFMGLYDVITKDDNRIFRPVKVFI
jgi:tRNA pseudouridine55 synthase